MTGRSRQSTLKDFLRPIQGDRKCIAYSFDSVYTGTWRAYGDTGGTRWRTGPVPCRPRTRRRTPRVSHLPIPDYDDDTRVQRVDAPVAVVVTCTRLGADAADPTPDNPGVPYRASPVLSVTSPSHPLPD